MLPHSVAIARLFLDRFSRKAPLSEKAYEKRFEEVAAQLESVPVSEDRAVLRGMLDAVDATLRTNVHREHRWALSMRLRPELMGHGTVGTEVPYGTFYVHGRRFRGFHVRFRDIARGGLRVVTPTDVEAHAAEVGWCAGMCFLCLCVCI